MGGDSDFDCDYAPAGKHAKVDADVTAVAEPLVLDPDHQYVIAFDFESAGGTPCLNGFTQLGAAFRDITAKKTIARFNMYASMSNYVWEERCLKEFWWDPKNKEIYDKTLVETANKDAPTQYEVIAKFVEWAKGVVTTPNGVLKHVYLLTDNPTFDSALLVFFSVIPILYLFGEYRGVIDGHMFMRGMSHTRYNPNVKAKDLAAVALGIDIPEFEVHHTHDASDDAEYIALLWEFIQLKL
jgi:hypothetical protein